MESLKNFIISVFGILITMGTSIMVMIKGWGLEPKNWIWIIIIYFLGHLTGIILAAISIQTKDK